MLRLALLLAFLVLTEAARAADDSALWQAAYALDTPGKAEAAEASLRKEGAAAYDVLVKLARVSGEEKALALAAGPRACRMFAMHRMGSHLGQAALPEQVAKLALKLLVETPEPRQRAETSSEPFDRAMALLAARLVNAGFGVPVKAPGAEELVGQLKAAQVMKE